MNAVLEAVKDLLLSLQSMFDKGGNKRLDIGNCRPVGWPIRGFGAGLEFLKTGKISGHIAIWRANDAGGPSQHVIACK